MGSQQQYAVPALKLDPYFVKHTSPPIHKQWTYNDGPVITNSALPVEVWIDGQLVKDEMLDSADKNAVIKVESFRVQQKVVRLVGEPRIGRSKREEIGRCCYLFVFFFFFFCVRGEEVIEKFMS